MFQVFHCGWSAEDENEDEGARAHFCHSALDKEVLRKLGMQSYRVYSAAANESPDDLHCPSSAVLHVMFEGLLGELDDQVSVKTALLQLFFQLFDLRAFVDGPHDIQVCLDSRQYPSNRLISPGLSQFQGPSLVLIIRSSEHGGSCHLDMNTLSELQLTSSPLQTQTEFGEVTLGEKFMNDTTCVLGLYSVSDLPVVVAGEKIFFFDPAACALSSSMLKNTLVQTLLP